MQKNEGEVNKIDRNKNSVITIYHPVTITIMDDKIVIDNCSNKNDTKI